MPSTLTHSESDYSNASDRLLLHCYALHQQDAAFDEIVCRYEKLVISVCRRTTRNHQDAEDAAQATFLALSKCPPTLQRANCLSSWLYGVAWRTSLRAVRKRRRTDAVELPQDVKSKCRTPLETITSLRDFEVLEEEMNRLPSHHRDVLFLNFILGYDRQQIAAELNATRGVIDGRIKRAKNALRIRLIRRGITLSALSTGLTLSIPEATATNTGISELSGFSTAKVTPYITSLARPELGFGTAGIKAIAAGLLVVTSIFGFAVTPSMPAFAKTTQQLEPRLEEAPDETADKPPVMRITSAGSKQPSIPDDKAGNETPSSKVDLFSEPGEWGSLRGAIKVVGDIPKPKLLFPKGANIKDSAVCASKNTLDDSLLIDKESTGLANCFVYLYRAPSKVHPLLKGVAAKKTLVQDQVNCQFVPRCQFIQTNQKIEVISSDRVAHNVHTYPLRNPATSLVVPLLSKPGKGIPYSFTKREGIPIQVKCDFHSWMCAYWLILDHPYAAITNSKGEFAIEGLPVGKHQLRIWHERVGYVDRNFDVEVAKGQMKVVRTVEVHAEKLTSK